MPGNHTDIERRLWDAADELRANSRLKSSDARHAYRQLDRAHRDFTPAQIEFRANIVRLYRGEEPETTTSSEAMLKEKSPKAQYVDVPGLCKVATVKAIEVQGWSPNPGRSVGRMTKRQGG